MNSRVKDSNRAQRELLSGSQLLGKLPEAILEPLVAASHVVELAVNQTLYESGQLIREAYLLFGGGVKRSVALPNGAVRVIQLVQREQLLSPGEVFGGKHYRSSCIAIAPALLVAIDARRLRELVQQSTELSCRIIGLLAQRQQATEFDVVGYHFGLTGTQRLLDFLLEQAGGQIAVAGETAVMLKASKKMIAARIGMTPESLSRSLRELSDIGAIVVDGRNIFIQNAALNATLGSGGSERLSFSRKRRGDINALPRQPSIGSVVNMCGRLRLMSQRMALSWGAVVSGLPPSRERIRLRQFEKEFVSHLERLERLDPGSEQGACLRAIRDVWPEFQASLADENAANARRVFSLSEDVLGLADRLASAVTQQANVPEAVYVNLAGRNRMLSQRIGKFFLFREWDGLQEAVAELMPLAHAEFEQNLRSLVRAGGQYPELVAQLNIVEIQWRKFIQTICPDLAYFGKNKHTRLVLVECESLLRTVNTAVQLFERLSR